MLVACIDLGTVSPQCLLEPQAELTYTYETEGSNNYVRVAAFKLHAFLTSPSIIGVAIAVALPLIALLAITVAKVAINRRSDPRKAAAASLAAPREPEPASSPDVVSHQVQPDAWR